MGKIVRFNNSFINLNFKFLPLDIDRALNIKSYKDYFFVSYQNFDNSYLLQGSLFSPYKEKNFYLVADSSATYNMDIFDDLLLIGDTKGYLNIINIKHKAKLKNIKLCESIDFIKILHKKNLAFILCPNSLLVYDLKNFLLVDYINTNNTANMYLTLVEKDNNIYIYIESWKREENVEVFLFNGRLLNIKANNLQLFRIDFNKSLNKIISITDNGEVYILNPEFENFKKILDLKVNSKIKFLISKENIVLICFSNNHLIKLNLANNSLERILTDFYFAGNFKDGNKIIKLNRNLYYIFYNEKTYPYRNDSGIYLFNLNKKDNIFYIDHKSAFKFDVSKQNILTALSSSGVSFTDLKELKDKERFYYIKSNLNKNKFIVQGRKKSLIFNLNNLENQVFEIDLNKNKRIIEYWDNIIIYLDDYSIYIYDILNNKSIAIDNLINLDNLNYDEFNIKIYPIDTDEKYFYLIINNKHLYLLDTQGKKHFYKYLDNSTDCTFISNKKVYSLDINNKLLQESLSLPMKIYDKITDICNNLFFLFDNKSYLAILSYSLNYSILEIYKLEKEKYKLEFTLSSESLKNCKFLGYIDKNLILVNKKEGKIILINLKNKQQKTFNLKPYIRDIDIKNNKLIYTTFDGNFYIEEIMESFLKEDFEILNGEQTYPIDKNLSIKHWENLLNILSFGNINLNSLETERHQLNPIGYKINIPNLTYLNNFNLERALNAFLGDGVNVDDKNLKQLSIIYHELFHVIQSIYMNAVFDYFSLIDNVQVARRYILHLLSHKEYFLLKKILKEPLPNTLIEAYIDNKKLQEKVKSDITFLRRKLLNTFVEEALNNYIDNEVQNVYERSKEIDLSFSKFSKNNKIINDLEEERKKQIKEDLLKKLDLEQIRKNIKKELEENSIYILINDIINGILTKEELIPLVEEVTSTNELEDFIDLIIEVLSLERINNYFDIDKEIGLSIFHLIESSAQVFGLCCAGIDVDKNFKYLEDLYNKNNIKVNDIYISAYKKFKNFGGKTPFLFIILTSYSLFAGDEPSKILQNFDKVLKTVPLFEEEINKLKNKKDKVSILQNILSMVETYFHGRGRLFNFDIYSGGLLEERIKKIKKLVSNKDFDVLILDIISNKDLVKVILDTFKQQENWIPEIYREEEVALDFEKFLYFKDLDFFIKCCSQHQFVDRWEFDIYLECQNPDSLINILTSRYKILKDILPEDFWGE